MITPVEEALLTAAQNQEKLYDSDGGAIALSIVVFAVCSVLAFFEFFMIAQGTSYRIEDVNGSMHVSATLVKKKLDKKLATNCCNIGLVKKLDNKSTLCTNYPNDAVAKLRNKNDVIIHYARRNAHNADDEPMLRVSAASTLYLKLLNVQCNLHLMYASAWIASMALVIVAVGHRNTEGKKLGFAGVAIFVAVVIMKAYCCYIYVDMLPHILSNGVNSIMHRSGVVFRGGGTQSIEEWRPILWMVSEHDIRMKTWCEHSGLGVQYGYACISIKACYESVDKWASALNNISGLLTLTTVLSVAGFVAESSNLKVLGTSVLAISVAILTAGVTYSVSAIIYAADALVHLVRTASLMDEVNENLIIFDKSDAIFSMIGKKGRIAVLLLTIRHMLSPTETSKSINKRKGDDHKLILKASTGEKTYVATGASAARAHDTHRIEINGVFIGDNDRDTFLEEFDRYKGPLPTNS